MPVQSGPVATRRVALAVVPVGLAVGALASGCDAEAPRREPAPSDTPRADPDPDQELVLQAIEQLTLLLGLTRTVARQAPSLADRVRPLVALHRAHLEALEAPAEAFGGDRPGRPVRVAELVRRERATQRRLAEAAVAAESGPLARLLASMAAGIGARLAEDDLRAVPR